MRRGITVTLAYEDIAEGWRAFAYVGYYLAQHGLKIDQLAYRWHREESGWVMTNFEVRKTA